MLSEEDDALLLLHHHAIVTAALAEHKERAASTKYYYNKERKTPGLHMPRRGVSGSRNASAVHQTGRIVPFPHPLGQNASVPQPTLTPQSACQEGET